MVDARGRWCVDIVRLSIIRCLLRLELSFTRKPRREELPLLLDLGYSSSIARRDVPSGVIHLCLFCRVLSAFIVGRRNWRCLAYGPCIGGFRLRTTGPHFWGQFNVSIDNYLQVLLLTDEEPPLVLSIPGTMLKQKLSGRKRVPYHSLVHPWGSWGTAPGSMLASCSDSKSHADSHRVEVKLPSKQNA